MRLDRQIQQAEAASPRWMRIAEGILLALVLAIAALRATIIETPHVEGMLRTSALSSEAISLLISSALLTLAALWVVLGALAGRLRVRPTYAAKAVGVFCAVALAGVYWASDKRAAITDLTVMLSGPAAGLLAGQLFDRREKVRLFLWLLLALAAAATYACHEKMTASNEQLVAEYKKNPAAMLALFGIEEGSLEHWQYEHRLYSKDISGFLTTSNSAGSFFLLAVFAGIGLCLEAFGARRGSEETAAALVCTALATAVALAGLIMTQSKGALGAFLICAAGLGAYVTFRQAIWAHRRTLGIGLILAGLGCAAALTMYGQKHGRLPGGNSMLVRWQYWTSSAQMARDYPVLGVGGGNFALRYMQYKTPAAPETVNDPHNWVFSLLCRFGIAGLAALAAAMLRPVIRMAAAGCRAETGAARGAPYSERFYWLGVLVCVIGALVWLRPLALQLSGAQHSDEEYAAAFLLLIIVPAGIAALVFGLLRFACAVDASLPGANTRLTAALAFGLAAVLLHNLVDFALFEPGVWTLFWLTAAAGIALICGQTEADGYRVLRLEGRRRWAIALAATAGCAALAVFAVLPPLRRGMLVYAALQAKSVGPAQDCLEKAAAADTLSPDAASAAAQLLLRRYAQPTAGTDIALLDDAQRYAETAIERSPGDPRTRWLLADVLLAKADRADHPAQRRTLQESAMVALEQATALYPGLEKLHYRLGVLAEELGRPAEATAHLETALAIETAYRAQFRVMYPAQDEVVSRLGRKASADLLERLERLKSLP